MTFKRVFSFSNEVWDPSHRFETSWLLTPWTLFFIRASISFYAFVVLIFNLIWRSVQASQGGPGAATLSFSAFTVLTYWGIAFYFLFASIHTFTYARSGTPLLNRFPQPLRALHSLFYTTIITYPFLVTIVYWAVLFTPPFWPDRYNQWSNISQHAMNSLFAVFELFFTRVNPPLWIHLLWLTIILGMYCGVAYLTKYTRDVYEYSFLDPSNGHATRVVAYVFGIAAGIIVIFLLVKGMAWTRKWATERKMEKTGKFHGGRSMGQGDVELEIPRRWEK